MMLRETFGRYDKADIMEEAVRSVWCEGWRTEDVAIPGCRVVGTRELGRRIAGRAEEIMDTRGVRIAARCELMAEAVARPTARQCALRPRKTKRQRHRRSPQCGRALRTGATRPLPSVSISYAVWPLPSRQKPNRSLS